MFYTNKDLRKLILPLFSGTAFDHAGGHGGYGYDIRLRGSGGIGRVFSGYGKYFDD